MEILGPNNSNNEFKEKIRKIKEYIESLFRKRNKKKREKVEDDIIEQIDEVFDDDNFPKKIDEEDFSEDEENDGGDSKEQEGNNSGNNNSESSEDDEGDEDGDEEGNQGSQSGNSGGKGGKSGQKGKSGKSKSGQNKKSEFETPPEDSDEYIPQDSEIGEAMGEQSRFAEIYPPFLGYYAKGKKSYFNRETNLWSKRKSLSSLSHKLPEGTKKYAYTGVITKGVNAIPLPDLAWPDTFTLHSTGRSVPEFQVDQNGCVYLISNEKQFVSFNFGLNQHGNSKAPVSADSDKIIYDSLSHDTQELLDNLRASGATPQQIAAAIKYYILKNKKYSTKVQGTLRNKSNRNNYIKHLDESPILECFSANSLFVALCRELGVPARLVVGHMVQSTNKEGKACLTKNDGHAWSEIWDSASGKWLRVDSTPTKKEDGEESNENGQEQNDSQNDDSKADNNFGENNPTGNKGNKGDKSDSKGEKSDNQSGEKTDSSDNSDSSDSSNSESNSESSDSSNSKSSSDSSNSSDSKSDSSDSSNSDSDSQSDNNSESNQNSNQKKSGEDKEQNSQGSGKGNLIDGNDSESNKSPSELLDEMVEKAKEDDLMKQAEAMKDVLDKLDNAQSKEDIKNILDESGLTDFAKDMVDKIGKDKILDEEKKEIEKLDDENKIDEALKNSLLDEDYKKRLKEYAKIMKDKILEEKRKMRSEMQRMGFTEQELGYYREYKQLEAEVEPEVRKQIRELQKILPVNYQILTNEKDVYRSGPKLDCNKLTEFAVTGDPLIFRRNHEVRESNEINMFETIIIDTSGSMGSIDSYGSILRESIKAAIIRAKVLEHFKVEFSIVLFGDRIDEVMSFGEKFSSKKKCSIPSRLMRAAHQSGGNSREPISYVYQNMLKQYKKNRGKSFGNISFIGDGDLYSGMQRPELKAMIEDLKRRGFGVTAYYINNSRSRLIDYYFGSQADGGAVYAGSSKELSKEIIEAHKTHLKKKIKKYMK